MPPHNVIHKGDLINIVKDSKFVDNIRFSKRFSSGLIQGILRELKTAVKISAKVQ
jgi:hypothetical protein